MGVILALWAIGAIFLWLGFIMVACFRSIFENKEYGRWTWVFHFFHMFTAGLTYGFYVYLTEEGDLRDIVSEAPYLLVLLPVCVYIFIASIRAIRGQRPFPRVKFNSLNGSGNAFNWGKWVVAPIIVFVVTSTIGYFVFDITPTITLQFGGMFSIFSVVVNLFTNQ